MNRRDARTAAVKVIFGYSFSIADNDESIEKLIASYMEEFYEKEDGEKGEFLYFCEVVKGTVANINAIDEKIKSCIKWDFDRLGKVDIAILRVAVYELLYRDDVPAEISINEAVEIAKIYASDDAPAFINGVLGNVCKMDSE